MARQYYKDSTTGQMKPLGVKVEDTLPVGTIVEYNGQDIPEGWVDIGNGKIEKQYQVIPTNAKLENGHSTSATNGYTCEYINKISDYSTTEQVIGTYDGKPLYRKIVKYTNSETIGNVSSVVNITIPHNISNLSLCTYANIIRAPYIFPRFSWDTTNNRVVGSYVSTVDQTNITFRILYDTWSAGNWEITIEYTKTTD